MSDIFELFDNVWIEETCLRCDCGCGEHTCWRKEVQQKPVLLSPPKPVFISHPKI